MAFCSNCGAELKPAAAFCSRCGAKTDAAPAAKEITVKLWLGRLRPGFTIAAIVFFVLAVAGILAGYFEDDIWHGIGAAVFYLVFAVAFFVLALSPKSKKNLLGRETGISKALFMFLMVLLAIVLGALAMLIAALITEGSFADAIDKLNYISAHS